VHRRRSGCGAGRRALIGHVHPFKALVCHGRLATATCRGRIGDGVSQGKRLELSSPVVRAVENISSTVVPRPAAGSHVMVACPSQTAVMVMYGMRGWRKVGTAFAVAELRNDFSAVLFSSNAPAHYPTRSLCNRGFRPARRAGRSSLRRRSEPRLQMGAAQPHIQNKDKASRHGQLFWLLLFGCVLTSPVQCRRQRAGCVDEPAIEQARVGDVQLNERLSIGDEGVDPVESCGEQIALGLGDE